MHHTRTVSARPVLLIAATLTLSFTPHPASADPEPVARESAEPVTRESAGDQGLARAPESAARRALGEPTTDRTGTVRGCPREQVLTPDPEIQGLGDRVSVEIAGRSAGGHRLVPGHWRSLPDGSGGPAAAAGRASVVSGRHAVLFGTEPLFRDHPKGEFAQVGRALFTMAHASSG
ncbi:hypothetical protein [Streptomyces sp. NPDC057253]|uniref:hypothetical protein n=1 Tax=Streptomyces sp. NPDC057253 TaxID=3346069 RepID=UPI00363E7AF9